MTEENKEVIEEITEENKEQPIEEVIEDAIDESKFNSADDPDVIKVDLDAPLPEQKVVEDKKENIEETKEEVVEEVTEQPIIEEVTEEEKAEEIVEAVEEAVEEAVATGKQLPENIQKLVDFMEETGGNINDYVQLNRDVSKMDDSDVLDEYYRSTKPHLTADERNFLMEDTFSYDDEIDDDKTKRKKKIALKEQVAEARAYLDRQKSKYYEEIKADSRLTEDQQKAINFYNESEKQKEENNKSKRTFLNKTDSFFGQNFKGFEYNVGDKKYRFNVKDVDKVKKSQSNINNFVSKFTNKENSIIEDTAGYHKSLFTAMNPDAIAKHFYEQGKADAIKSQVAKDKNIDLNPRKMHGETNVGGVKFKVLGQSSSDMKNRSFKIRKKS
tara:strand:- start:1075 stop:2229 length:1155 start_codon:yes stop_codon:yes gene_type:complete